MFDDVIEFIRTLYGNDEKIHLHSPLFIGNEKKYLNECIDSSYVSSVGMYVDRFEDKISQFTGSKYSIATMNGTSALHIALLIAGVDKDCEVITQPLSFVATCNAIQYCGSNPIFVDVDKDTLGLSPVSLENFLIENAKVINNKCINKKTGKIIRACVPMHTFGHPCKLNEINEICNAYKIIVIEDAAESLGSFYNNKHTGTFGSLGIFSFNGNKIITGGGGGCIITNNQDFARKAKHISTTAKIPSKWEFSHDMTGYNYRMPNLNAALLLSQIEKLELFLSKKRKTATSYKDFFENKPYNFIHEPLNCKSNYWLNGIILRNKKERDLFLNETNLNGVATRPIWKLLNKLTMFAHCQCADLSNSIWLEQRVVNLPSSALKK
jgi:aminotransferase in exopolysaccharide biosynthesis